MKAVQPIQRSIADLMLRHRAYPPGPRGPIVGFSFCDLKAVGMIV